MKLKIRNLKEIEKEIISGKIKEYNMTDKINVYEYCKYDVAIKKAFKYYYSCNYINKDYPMDCIYITGETGVGKSVLSKKIAKDNNYKSYISSISNDILDNYKGQECIILDNIRSNSIDLSDLIVILDNNARHSNIKSRCKLHIKIDSKYIYYSVWNPIEMKYNKPHIKPNTLLDDFQIKALSKKEAKEMIYKDLGIDLDKDDI